MDQESATNDYSMGLSKHKPFLTACGGFSIMKYPVKYHERGMVMTYLLLLLAFASVGVLCASLFEKRIESMLPAGFFCIALIGYVCGMLGVLSLSLWLILLLSLGCYAVSIGWAWKRGQLGAFLRRVFTPAFFAYCALFVLVVWINRGRMIFSYDEFTHWGDVVKVMCQYDCFASYEQTRSYFGSYPPAMALLEYFGQRVHRLLSGSSAVCEDLIFMVYQWAMIALFMPFIEKKKSALPAAACAFLTPLVTFPVSAYSQLMMEGYLSTLGAFAMVYAFWHADGGWLESVYLALALFMLVLSKDIGLLLALAALVMLLCVRGFGKKEWRFCLLPTAAVVLSKLSWQAHLALHDIRPLQPSLSRPVVLSELFAVLAGAPDRQWRRDLITDYIGRFLENSFGLWMGDMKITYLSVLLLLAGGLFWWRAVCGEKSVELRKRATAMTGIFTVTTIVYIGGLLITYLFKFSRREAERLATWDRYMGLMIAVITTAIVMCVMVAAARGMLRQRTIAILTTALMLLVSWPYVLDTLARTGASASIAYHAPYEAMAQDIKAKVEADGAPCDGSVYILFDDWNHFLTMRYRLRPLTVGDEPYLTESDAVVDVKAERKTADELREIVLGRYGYVLVTSMVDDFMERYSELFENPADIAENRLYRVDEATGRFVWMP